MNTTHYRTVMFGVAAGIATLLPFGAAAAQETSVGVAVRGPAVPVQTMTYRSDSDQSPAQEVRWGRGYYRGPYGYYGGPRRYSGYRGSYGAPYGAYYPGYYYRPRYGYGPGYGAYYGGGVRVGRVEVFWR